MALVHVLLGFDVNMSNRLRPQLLLMTNRKLHNALSIGIWHQDR